MAMLSLEAEQATAHLTVLGWKPVMIKYRTSHWRSYGVQNVQTKQFARVSKGRDDQVKIDFEHLSDLALITEIEWWKLTDLSILTLVAVIDNTLIGWGGCE